MKRLPAVVEILLLGIFLVSAWIRVEADRDNPPEPLPPGDAEVLIRQAKAAYEQGDIAQASRLYWHAIKLDRTQVEARVRLAAIYQSPIHSWESDALKLLNDALRYDPDHIEAHLLRGKILRNQGEREAAAREYQKVLERDPNNAEAHYHLGTAYEASQQYDQAAFHYQQAIEHDPNLVQPPFETYPFGLQARLQLARLLKRQKDYERAIALLEEALQLRPDFGDARSELIALLYKRASQFIREDADPGIQLANYQRILKVDPQDSQAWLRIGQLYEHQFHQLDKALEAYQRAYDLDPLNQDALLNIRSLEIQRQQQQETQQE